MKRMTVLFLATIVPALLMTDRAVGQGSPCRNGMCSTTKTTHTMPVMAKVFPLAELGPVEKQIVELEKGALEKWYAGDPAAYIALMGSDIAYFEPALEKRLDGREPLKEMYEALRGRVHADKFDMLNTRVQATENMAVLSYNLLAVEQGIPFRWNCTEVFSLDKDGRWKLVHSHWSQTKPSGY